MTIADRIRLAFKGERKLRYGELARRVFPQDEYPKAWHYRSEGGPPVCYMVLTAALNRMGCGVNYEGMTRWVFKPKDPED